MEENLIRIRHEQSKKDFPKVDFSKDEYVEFYFARVPSCIFMIWIRAFLVILILGIIFAVVNNNLGVLRMDEMGKNFIYIVFSIIIVVILAFSMALTIVHRGNRLLLTNKRAIQHIKISPLASSVNIIDLASIEDVSFHQKTLSQKLFRYGTLRLATVGDETTYTFPYCHISGSELSEIMELVSAARKSSKSDDK